MGLLLSVKHSASDPVILDLLEIFIKLLQHDINGIDTEMTIFNEKFDNLLILPKLIDLPHNAKNQPIMEQKDKIDTKLDIEMTRIICAYMARLKQLNILNPTTMFGKGSLIKKLLIPSEDPHLNELKLLLNFMPNLKSLKFAHHQHDKQLPAESKFTIQPHIFKQLHQLGIDDIESQSWVELLNDLRKHGHNLKSLTLEACPEKDPFHSNLSMANVFPSLKNLEHLRLDGVPLSTHYFGWGGDKILKSTVRNCTKLRAISIDFADITLSSFYTLWNNCPNLEFLGLAAVSSGLSTIQPLKINKNIKVLRLVDCQVSDELVPFLIDAQVCGI